MLGRQRMFMRLTGPGAWGLLAEFATWIGLAVVHACVLALVPIFLYGYVPGLHYNQDDGLYVLGTIAYTGVIFVVTFKVGPQPVVRCFDPSPPQAADPALFVCLFVFRSTRSGSWSCGTGRGPTFSSTGAPSPFGSSSRRSTRRCVSRRCPEMPVDAEPSGSCQ